MINYESSEEISDNMQNEKKNPTIPGDVINNK